MSDMYNQYHSVCPGLDTKTKGHCHSSRCRLIRIASLEAPFDAEQWAKVIVAFIQRDLSAGKLDLDPGRHVLRVEDVPVRHIDVMSQAPSTYPAPTEQPPDEDSDPSGTGEQLQLEL